MEKEKQIEKIKEEDIEFEWVNDRHLEYLSDLKYSILPDKLKKCGYEKLFRIKDVEQLKKILEDEDLKRDIIKKINKFGFVRSSCCFFFSFDSELDLDLWKKTIDFQNKIFSDITVTCKENEYKRFEEVLAYALEKDKPIQVFIDLEFRTGSIREIVKTVINNEKIEGLKVKYRKFTSGDNLQKYFDLKNLFKETNKKIHLTFANLKCNITGYGEICSEAISIIFGFSSFCPAFKEKIKIKGRRFAPTVTVFFKESLEYKEVTPDIAKDFRAERIDNIRKVNETITKLENNLKNNTFEEYLETKPKFKSLLAYLKVSV